MTETVVQDNTRASLEETWYLKNITFTPPGSDAPKPFKIITQNYNGPCSFIAICNILILRGDIEILPQDRTSVSYEQLAQLLAEFLLTSKTDVDIDSALATMPVTRKGMDLNPLFTGITSFRPATDGGELKLFEHAGIKLVHGWLVDPASHEYQTVSKIGDYDTAVHLIAEADHLSRGQLVPEHAGSSPSSVQGDHSLSPENEEKIRDAYVLRSFLDSTSSQLTYHGLFALASELEPGALVALFRNSHLSVLYKSSHPEDSALYTLATDQVFLREASIVWERLEDIDGGWSTFVDSAFVRSTPVGGDYAGETAQSTLAAIEGDLGALTLEERADLQLARQLQEEENQRLNAMEAERHRRLAEQEQQQKLEEMAKEAKEARKKERKSKKGDCVIM
ncbi:hypothetical protein BDY19DRAFT_992447 [Irpex rosettiformis]|uniref:Uncharacterized protein n=1 Tax=Irpex rosettiformis TaxID=378272 RepID=A0ACB8U7P5_9APHY|nr:hypothetical protein BDY19DRAFT_992447 [Irpex rosettiformis]